MSDIRQLRARAMVDGYKRYRPGARDPGQRPPVIEIRGNIGPDAAVRADSIARYLGRVCAAAPSLEVVIDSNGGNLAEARRIYAILRAAGKPVTARVVGSCASAATIVLLAGDWREAITDAKFLLHEVEVPAPSGERWTAQSHREVAKTIERLNSELAKFYAGRCGKPLAEFERAIRNEQGFGVNWATRLNLIHSVLDPDTAKVF